MTQVVDFYANLIVTFKKIFDNFSEESLLFFETKTEEEKLAILESIDKYDVTIADIKTENYNIHDGLYYSATTYTISYDTDKLVHIDAINFCDICENNFEDTLVECIDDRHGHYILVCDDCVRGENLARDSNNRYYTQHGQERCDMTFCNDDCRLHEIDNLFYHDSDGEYHLDPEEEDTKYTEEYHDATRKFHRSFQKSEWRVGFEIEKEDQDVLTSVYIEDFKNSCQNWCKERDGSLNDNSGFELISPAFGLDDTQDFLKEVENNSTLLKHINADYSSNCGGHIHISNKSMTPKQVLESLKGYIYMSYALYSKRQTNVYCKAISINDIFNNSFEKRQAWRITDDTLEIRIISAVKNFSNFKGRLLMLKAMTKNTNLSSQETLDNAKINEDFKIWLDYIYEKDTEKISNFFSRWQKEILKWEVK